MIVCDEIGLFQEKFCCFKQAGYHFYGHTMNPNQNHVTNKMALSFLCRMKDDEVMVIFLKSCNQKLEEEEEWQDSSKIILFVLNFQGIYSSYEYLLSGKITTQIN